MEQLDLHMKTKSEIVTRRKTRENLERMTRTMKNPRNVEEVAKALRKKRKQGTIICCKGVKIYFLREGVIRCGIIVVDPQRLVGTLVIGYPSHDLPYT